MGCLVNPGVNPEYRLSVLNKTVLRPETGLIKSRFFIFSK